MPSSFIWTALFLVAFFAAGCSFGSNAGAPPTSPSSTAISSRQTVTLTSEPAPFTLLFSSDRAGRGGIYALTDSGVPQRLTYSSAGDWDPAPDPTGELVAFTSYRWSNGDIYVMDADGNNLRRLTTHSADDYWPAWSPDGNSIAFVSERDGGRDLYVLDVERCLTDGISCDPQRVSADTGLWRHRHPAWSPDGSALIFMGIDTNGIGEIYRLELDSGELTRLTEWPLKASMPAVAPDGTIAMQVWEEGPIHRLAVLEPGTEEPRTLLETSDWFGNLAWTPDGRAILFTMWTEKAGSHDIYMLPREGGTPQRLTGGQTWDDFAATIPASSGGLPVEVAVQTPPAPRDIPQEWGVNVADLGHAYLIHDLGFTWGKGFVDWSRVEPEQDDYVWIDVDNTVEGFERAGVKTLLRVHNTPAWARPEETTVSHPPTNTKTLSAFAETLATRYQGRVEAYEIWNEPNLAFEWGNEWPEPARYAELVNAAAPALRAGDPNAAVVAGALAVTGTGSDRAIGDLDYLRSFYAATPTGAYDALSTHPYGFGRPPATPPDEALGLRRAEEHRAIMEAHGDADTPLWLTEVGWIQQAPAWNLGEHGQGAVTAAQQAVYWRDAARYIEANWPWAQTVFVFNLDFSTVPWYNSDEQMRWYALLNPDGSPQPAYSALRAWRRGY